ncbi:MAG: 23S rRNA (adenine(2503)-C(2))-methyltransferase RlmN [Alphaproteobacteria bacterium]|nr:23S rRNA (adenine(2503)-C(2))-methyltransferase RlmN [Alphaproteobacteria bacterium]
MELSAYTEKLMPPPHAMDARTNIVGMAMPALQLAFGALGLEKFRAKQVWQWVYSKGETEFGAMSNLAKPVREKLAEHFYIGRPAISRDQQSEDGTRKWLLKMHDGQEVESVHIPEEDRGALCVSSQVGCTLTCRFCHTGTQRLVRNLEPAEIVGQVMLARDHLADWPSNRENRKLSNIVMMGMGEPLFNFENVAAALKIVMDNEGLAISKRRITLSTSGVVPMIERCGAELGVNLAVSLHAVTDELRDQIIPLNRKYPIKQLMQACRDYPGLSNARRITFEYVMLKGVNDSDADAKALVRLIGSIPAKINLIPFNPWPGAPFECSDDARITRFGDIVNAAGYASPVRTPRGRDIMAACGQLKSASLRLTAAERAAINKLIADKERAAGLLPNDK